MNQADREVRKYLTARLKILQQNNAYSEIAELITTSLQENSSRVNREVFGYLPLLFREVELSNWSQDSINSNNLPIGEPVTYKISFPHNQTMKGIPFFYLFCHIKSPSDQINVYFQSASQISDSLKQQDYKLAHKKIVFEGLISAFTSEESVICISDPGHFIPGLKSSFYVGTPTINFAQYIANIVENICNAASIKLENTFLFGSSAGGMGALLSSTYFSNKVQVLAVNTQIYTHGLARVMNVLLGTRDREVLVKKYGDRVSCFHRFKQNLRHVPNIYLLANVNDGLYQRNYKFYQQYQNLFVAKGKVNQSIFDSYYGVDGHGRPDKVTLKKKIAIARESLTMKTNLSGQITSFPPKQTRKDQSNLSQKHDELDNDSIKANLSNVLVNQDSISHNKLLECNSQKAKVNHQFGKSVQVSNPKVNLEKSNKLQQSFSHLKSFNRNQKEYFDSYISLGDNCEAGIQFVRTGYTESSFFRFTSSPFKTTYNIIKNDFQDIFDRRYIVPRPKVKKMVMNTKYNISFHSKLTSTIDSKTGEQKFLQAYTLDESTYSFDEMFQNEQNKIQYLIGKWNNLLESNKNILFILKNDSQKQYITQEKAEKLVKLLLDKYNNSNLKILCIQLDKFKESQWKNNFLFNRYFPYFAPRTSVTKGDSPTEHWCNIFKEFPLSSKQHEYLLEQK